MMTWDLIVSLLYNLTYIYETHDGDDTGRIPETNLTLR